MYISIDIGGTNTRILMTRDYDNPNLDDVVYIPTKQSYTDGLQDIFSFIDASQPKAIAIGFAGGINPETQNVDGSNALPNWHNKPLGNDFREKYACPVFVNNDAVMGAYGEAYDLGNKQDFMYLTWGTGLGGALVEWVDDKVKVYRPEDRTLLYKIEEGVGGSYCEKHFGKTMSELNNEEWNWIISNVIDGTKQLSQSSDWGKKTFVLGGGITTKQLERLKILTQETEVKIILSRLSDNSGLLGGLAVIKETI